MNIDIKAEIKEKEKRLHGFMDNNGYGAVIINKQNSFAWLTCGGDNHVGIATETGSVTAIVTKSKKYIIANNIEAPRIKDEEINDQGFEVVEFAWNEADRSAEIIKEITDGMRVASDEEIAPLRYSLTQPEIEKYRWIGHESSKSLKEVSDIIKPGDSEHKVAGLVAERLLPSGIIPIVLLIAADERIKKYRHPIPTDNRIKKHVMIVVCARKWGLITSLTRLVHFGSLPAELREKHDAVTEVDASFTANTRPGNIVGDIFSKALDIYERTGFRDEWKLHHQGGATGYSCRDYKGTSDSKEVVELNQAFAWNPSITGTKSEDTIIALKDKTEIITQAEDWPMLTVKYEDQSIQKPDIYIK
ncbi:M24 family metallopeptidase [bacterium]|nr:M24 family metallopeptidase [bacterium]